MGTPLPHQHLAILSPIGYIGSPAKKDGRMTPVVVMDTDVSRARLWLGRILSYLPAAFLLVDAVMKLVKPSFVVEATVELGYPQSCIVGLGVVLLLSTILYLLPKTSVLGAILVTGYLGGAVATNVRVSTGWFNIIFPVIFGIAMWTGLVLRSPQLHAAIGRPPRV
jgi:hypothetical protein